MQQWTHNNEQMVTNQARASCRAATEIIFTCTCMRVNVLEAINN